MKFVLDYEKDIIKLHNVLIDYPDNISLNNKLKYRLGKWVSLLDIEIHVANNENTPWTNDEMGMPTTPMIDRKKSGFYNVADYQAFIKDYNTWCGLLVERKGGKIGVEDMYSTFMRKENRDRFYREVQKYHDDERFSQMVIMCEGSMQDFLSYSPKFNGNTYNKNHIGANVASRRSTVAGLFARGVPILWCGNRAQAVKLYPQMIRQYCIKNYTKILNLENSQ